MVSKRIPLKGGGEHDTFSRWRKVLCYLSRSGVVKSIKRKYSKRMRKRHKMELTYADKD
jgi:hypothetical protein